MECFGCGYESIAVKGLYVSALHIVPLKQKAP